MRRKNIKDKLFIAVIVVIVSIGAVEIFNSDLEHIEDTNGAENFSLQTITDDNIVNQDIGAMNVTVSKDEITNMTKISSKKFTGVYEVLYTNLIGKSDFVLNLYDFKISGGNFKMAVVHDDKIVKILTPENADEFVIEDINGTVSLIVAGESAEFSFKMTTFEYEEFSHR
jgi:hypothetical protein